MLQDRARIWVEAGAGGNGAVSFRREAHVPRGGPDGGDGGHGADVVLVADPSLRDLQAFRRRRHWKAQRGGHGEGSNRHGASPPALEVLGLLKKVRPMKSLGWLLRMSSMELCTPTLQAQAWASCMAPGHQNRLAS